LEAEAQNESENQFRYSPLIFSFFVRPLPFRISNLKTMKRVTLLAAILIFSINSFAQNAQTNFDLTNYGVRIEPDKRVLTVLAALEAAGVDTPLSEDGAKFRQQLKTEMLGLDPELRKRLVIFVEQYKRRHPKLSNAEVVAPFISMAYSLTPAPDFAEPSRATDLPGDLLDVLDFAPLVREFYREFYRLPADSGDKNGLARIDRYFADYQAAGINLRPSAAQMVGELLDYLHTKPQLIFIDRIKTESKNAKGKKTLTKVETRERERQFYIVPEMLAPKGTINFVNVGDNYYAIVPPRTDLSASEVRRAYLQFVIDPLVLANAKEVSTVREGIKSLLTEQRKLNPEISPDVFLAISRSLVAATEARQIEYEKVSIATAQARQKIDRMKTETEKKAVSTELAAFKDTAADETALQLSEAYEKGAVLSFYFADQLKGLEDSGFDIAGSLRDIILSLDTTKEIARLTQFADARKRALADRCGRCRHGRPDPHQHRDLAARGRSPRCYCPPCPGALHRTLLIRRPLGRRDAGAPPPGRARWLGARWGERQAGVRGSGLAAAPRGRGGARRYHHLERRPVARARPRHGRRRRRARGADDGRGLGRGRGGAGPGRDVREPRGAHRPRP